jgi:hypothetical protein
MKNVMFLVTRKKSIEDFLLTRLTMKTLICSDNLFFVLKEILGVTELLQEDNSLSCQFSKVLTMSYFQFSLNKA